MAVRKQRPDATAVKPKKDAKKGLENRMAKLLDRADGARGRASDYEDVSRFIKPAKTLAERARKQATEYDKQASVYNRKLDSIAESEWTAGSKILNRGQGQYLQTRAEKDRIKELQTYKPKKRK